MLKLTKLGIMVKSLSNRESYLMDRLIDDSYQKAFPDTNTQWVEEIKSLKEKGLIEGE
jgi:hypothetical protein